MTDQDEFEPKISEEDEAEQEAKARKEALEEAVSDKIKQKEYTQKADEIWSKTKQHELNAEDQGIIYDSLTKGDLESASARLDGVLKERKDEAEYRDVVKRFSEGRASRKEYEAVMKKRGLL